MSFHPDIVAITPFIPHPFQYIIEKNAFPTGAVPEPAYQSLCKQYAALEDVTVQRATYRSDGLAITGLIAFPKLAQDKHHDLVIYNRGGSGNFGMLTVRAVMTQLVPLARAGYVVIASNYRGNDGGEGREEFGGRDVDDVIALHDIMRSHALINTKPCYVIGHSRGGMMTYLLIKRGLPMRAAIAIAAISDLVASGIEHEGMRERVYKRLIPDFETNADALLIARSALYWPESLTVPLLLLHGTNDDRVPHSQSVALAEALTQHHQPHELVLYEGGGHALVRTWTNVIERTLAWMKEHS